MRIGILAGLLAICASASGVRAQAARLDGTLAPHRTAMETLKPLDGVWRGTGWTLLPSGEKASFNQTIRVGPAGEGALKVIEGRTYDAEGKLTSTNFEVMSYNAATKAYTLRVYSQGTAGDAPIKPTANGFTLEYRERGARVRFTIAVTDGVWSEVAERTATGKPTVRFLELTLNRAGDTDWPAAGAIRD